MLRPGQPGRSPGSRWAVGAPVLILPREVPRPLGPWGAMQLWGFQKVHRLFPTLSGRTVLSLKLTRKGWGRLKRLFIYIIFFFPICKIMPSESTLPLGSSTKSKNLQLKKSEQPFQGLDCAELPEAARPAVWKPASGAAQLRGDHVADARAPRRAEQPRSAGRGGRVGLALIRGRRTLRLRRHG